MQNNMELIRREDVLFLLRDAISCLKELKTETNNDATKFVLNNIVNMYSSTLNVISRCPIIDAVPVVRCKDCKHRYSSEFCECRPEDAFCSDGERRQ